MKPPPFEYDAPDDRRRRRSRCSPSTATRRRSLAGGQSLVPLLNFRLARPDRLVDLNRLGELADIRRRGRGAADRRADAPAARSSARRSSPRTGRCCAEALGCVAHAADPQPRHGRRLRRARRSRGGAARGARRARRARARRARRAASGSIAASELFVTHLTTALEPDELLVEIEVPPVAPGTGHARSPSSRAGTATSRSAAPRSSVTVDAAGVCERAAIALLAAAPTPVRATEAEALLVGARLDDAAARARPPRPRRGHRADRRHPRQRAQLPARARSATLASSAARADGAREEAG